MNLPACEYRVSTSSSNAFLCRHARVHAANNVVSAKVCSLCIWYDKACAPRDVEQPDTLPTFRERVSAYAAALARWTAAGFPVRTPERQAEVLAICEACPHFIREEPSHGCSKCGCRKTLGVGGLRQKVTWATEDSGKDPATGCPLGKW